MNEDINLDKDIPSNAVSLYGQQDAMDDFPVLKAFQQYIDSEQAKARKRMVMLSIFFGMLMAVVVTFFIILLMNFSSRNQALNDRMLEYVMKERERPGGSAVVVQPPQDNSALLSLSSKLDEMQKKLADSQAAAQKAAAEAAAAQAQALKPKEQTAEEREIERLKALLAAEKKQAAIEKEKKRKAEIEAYRRKHYPELYQDDLAVDEDDDELDEPVIIRRPKVKRAVKRSVRETKTEKKGVDVESIDALLKEVDAIKYYDEEEPDKAKEPTKDKPATAPEVKVVPEPQNPLFKTPAQKNNSIPVEIKGSSSSWSIPLE